MSNAIMLQGMHGLGDNLHQRAVVRQLMARGHEVWLETPWPCVYHDLAGPNLKLMCKGSALRTQAKNARRESARFTRLRPPRGTATRRIWYAPAAVRQHRSVLGALCESAGCHAGDFTLPVPADWQARAQVWLDRWRPDKPLLVLRPLIERTEWSGCAARNPLHDVYAELLASIRARFFVVSVADLVPGREWLVGPRIHGDAEVHAGELDFETLAALTQRAALIMSSPGFAVILAQAVGTPSVCVFGGYEAGYSFSGGARFAPHLAIEPIHPCDCFQHHHACDKSIDLARARADIAAFAAAAAPPGVRPLSA